MKSCYDSNFILFVGIHQGLMDSVLMPTERSEVSEIISYLPFDYKIILNSINLNQTQ